MAELTRDAVSALVRDQIEGILGSAEGRSRYGLQSRYTPEVEDRIDWMEKAIRGFQNDYSLGRVFTGPTWLSGTSVIDGTITAAKLIVNTLEAVTANTGDLNVTGSITAAASFPATGARIEINSTGLVGYSEAVTTTFKLLTDGSGEIGTGATKMSWDTSGVVTIPVAAIGSLTIAEVGGGILGGTYQTNAGTSRIDLSTTGIVAYASGTETFRLNGTTGAVTATGSFTIKSAASGARVEISNAGGIVGYNSGGTQTFLLNAATGAGQLGTGTVSWDSSGGVSINGSVLVNGSVIANAITSGTLTSGATVNLGTADVVVNSTGKLKFGASSADYLSNNILHFEVSSSESARVEFKNAANSPYAYVAGRASSSLGQFYAYGYYSSSIYGSVTATGTSTSGDSTLRSWHNTYGETYVSAVASSSAAVQLVVNGNAHTYFEATDRRARFAGYIYPGTGSAQQTSRYIYDQGSYIGISGGLYLGGSLYPSAQTTNGFSGSSTSLTAQLGGTTSSYQFNVLNSGATSRFMVRADGAVGISTGVVDTGATSVSTVTAAWALYDTGGTLLGYVPIYSSYA